MDLLSRFDRDTELVVLPHDLAVLMVGVAARQAASATAVVHAGSGLRPATAPGVDTAVYRAGDDALFRPVSGAFNGGVASAMARWQAVRATDCGGIDTVGDGTGEGPIYRAVSAGVQAPCPTDDRTMQGLSRPDRGLE